jgi:hypothetical protein
MPNGNYLHEIKVFLRNEPIFRGIKRLQYDTGKIKGSYRL